MAVTSSLVLQLEKSALFVPLVVGDQARGLINIVDMEQENAFSESDVRLLQTLANSMSVALENARLFDETQRLLKETEQRNAELAIINSVQAALAAELNIQGIYDVVGDKIREIFHGTDMNIRIYDPKTGMVYVPYIYEGGKRTYGRSQPWGDRGFEAYVFRTRETLVINENMAQEMEKYGSYVMPGTLSEKSAVFVPLVVGDQARGLIISVNVEREHAFSESDVRLLQTLANSMSVALENARLFDEVQKKNIEITESLERRLPPPTVLRVIAGSPTGIQAGFGRSRRECRQVCARPRCSDLPGGWRSFAADHSLRPPASPERR